jgi:hypothetical protein
MLTVSPQLPSWIIRLTLKVEFHDANDGTLLSIDLSSPDTAAQTPQESGFQTRRLFLPGR